MGDTKTTLTWLLRDQVSATAKGINTQLDTMGVKAKGASGILGKLGDVTGGLISPTTLGASAILGFGAAAVGAAKASIEAEDAYRRMGQSLQANVPYWDGNTRAVSDDLDKIEAWSAFTKNDLRNSFTLLVGATHNVNDALKVQQTAMDLARYKGISLQDATEALTRVEGGSYRILKSLGIVLPATATQVQALAAVEKVAAGQAADYGQSHAAALDRISNAWNDMIANVGGLVVEGGDEFGTFVGNVQQGVTTILAPLGNARDAIGGVVDQLHLLPSAANSAGTSAAGLARDFDKNLTPAINGTNAALDRMYAKTGLSAQDTINLFLGSREKTKTPAAPRSGPAKARASGGPVEAGNTYTVGEHGPETLTMYGGGGYVTPHGGGGGFTIQGVSEAQIVAMVDRGLYFKLSRSSPSAARK